MDLTTAKAQVAAVGAALTGFLTALSAVLPETSNVRLILVSLATTCGTIATAFTTWKVPNKPTTPSVGVPITGSAEVTVAAVQARGRHAAD